MHTYTTRGKWPQEHPQATFDLTHKLTPQQNRTCAAWVRSYIQALVEGDTVTLIKTRTTINGKHYAS